MRGIRFVPDAWDAYLYWHEQDKKTLKRINALITAAARDPFAGIGKPEPLRGSLSGLVAANRRHSPSGLSGNR